jgi:hypothetical protein
MSEPPSPPSFDPLSQSTPPVPPPPPAPTAYPGGASVPAPAPAPEPLAYPGGAPASAPAVALPGPLAKLTGTTLLWIQVVGGVLAFIATLLPWYSVSIDGFEGFGGNSTSGNGFDKSGGMATLILLLGLIVAALAFVSVRKIPLGNVTLPWFVAPAAAALLFLFSLIEWISTLGDVSDAKKAFGGGVFGVDLGIHASSGFGIWLLILVALVTLAAAVLQTLPQIMALTGKKPAA